MPGAPLEEGRTETPGQRDTLANGLGRRSGLSTGCLWRDLGAARKSHDLQTKCGWAWNSETNCSLPAPGRASQPCCEATRVQRGSRWEQQPGRTLGGPAGVCCGHEARAPFQSTYSPNVYRLAVLAGLSTAHVFLYFLFFFFNIFYKKKKILYKQYIYGFL